MEHVIYGYGNLSIIYNIDNNHGHLQILTTFTHTHTRTFASYGVHYGSLWPVVHLEKPHILDE